MILIVLLALGVILTVAVLVGKFLKRIREKNEEMEEILKRYAKRDDDHNARK